MSYDINSTNYVEFSVLQKANAKTRFMKWAIILGGIIVFIAIFALLLSIGGIMLVFVPIVLILIAFVITLLWKYTSIEYDCVLAAGDMQASIIYGGKKRKELFTQKISSFEIIANKEKSSFDDAGYVHIYKCISSESADNIVYATFRNENDEKCIVYFQPIKKAYSILKFYNMSAYKIG